MSRSALALAALAALVVGGARQVSQGGRAVETCDAALEQGDNLSAISSARLAAESLLPGSPYPARGYDRLAKIGTDAEARGDLDTAGTAWRSMRAAAVETRALGSGSARWLALANDGLSRVAVREAPGHEGVAARMEILARVDGPPTWELMLLAAVGAGALATMARFRRQRPDTIGPKEAAPKSRDARRA